jgi:hypothetical protein
MPPQQSAFHVIRLQVHSTDPGRSTPKLIEEIQQSAPQLAQRLDAGQVQVEREQAIPIDPATQILIIKVLHYVTPIVISELTKRAVNALLDMFEDAIIEPVNAEDHSKERKTPEK